MSEKLIIGVDQGFNENQTLEKLRSICHPGKEVEASDLTYLYWRMMKCAIQPEDKDTLTDQYIRDHLKYIEKLTSKPRNERFRRLFFSLQRFGCNLREYHTDLHPNLAWIDVVTAIMWDLQKWSAEAGIFPDEETPSDNLPVMEVVRRMESGRHWPNVMTLKSSRTFDEGIVKHRNQKGFYIFSGCRQPPTETVNCTYYRAFTDSANMGLELIPRTLYSEQLQRRCYIDNEIATWLGTDPEILNGGQAYFGSHSFYGPNIELQNSDVSRANCGWRGMRWVEFAG